VHFFSPDFVSTVECLAGFLKQGWLTPFDCAAAGAVSMQAFLNAHISDKSLGKAIVDLSKKLEKAPFHGEVPTDKKELLKLVDENVASLMMAQAFHSNEIVIGLYARKILTALDMYDWEDSGTKIKTDVRMKTISAARVQKSLETWMPKGTGQDFHEVMESLGAALDVMRQGSWGTIQAAINSNFSTRHKQTVVDMVNTILQFFKATKSRRGTRKSSG
jgi:endonuclease III